MQKRNLSSIELDTCEKVVRSMRHQDSTVSIPAEVLYNLVREVKVSRHKLAKAGAVKAELEKELEEIKAQWEKLNVNPVVAKKEEAASTAMDTTSSVELATSTQKIIPQEDLAEQYLKEKHLQTDTLEEHLADDMDVSQNEYHTVANKYIDRLLVTAKQEGGAEDGNN